MLRENGQGVMTPPPICLPIRNEVLLCQRVPMTLYEVMGEEDVSLLIGNESGEPAGEDPA